MTFCQCHSELGMLYQWKCSQLLSLICLRAHFFCMCIVYAILSPQIFHANNLFSSFVSVQTHSSFAFLVPDEARVRSGLAWLMGHHSKPDHESHCMTRATRTCWDVEVGCQGTGWPNSPFPSSARARVCLCAGDESDLHIIIFDEIDAICKVRAGCRARERVTVICCSGYSVATTS